MKNMIISVQSYEELNDAANSMMSALYAALAKMRDSGLSDCVEFDQGVTAIRQWEEYTISSIKRIEKELEALK